MMTTASCTKHFEAADGQMVGDAHSQSMIGKSFEPLEGDEL